MNCRKKCRKWWRSRNQGIVISNCLKQFANSKNSSPTTQKSSLTQKNSSPTTQKSSLTQKNSSPTTPKSSPTKRKKQPKKSIKEKSS